MLWQMQDSTFLSTDSPFFPLPTVEKEIPSLGMLFLRNIPGRYVCLDIVFSETNILGFVLHLYYTKWRGQSLCPDLGPCFGPSYIMGIVDTWLTSLTYTIGESECLRKSTTSVRKKSSWSQAQKSLCQGKDCCLWKYNFEEKTLYWAKLAEKPRLK